MPQATLPTICSDEAFINDRVRVYRQDKSWVYFLREYPIYSHKEDDLRMFEITTSLLIESGLCRQIEIIKTFGVSKSRVVRALTKLQEGGLEAFFRPRKNRSPSTGGSYGRVMTPEILKQAQSLLEQNYSRHSVASQLHVPYDTLRKACTDGRLQVKKKEKE